MSDDADDPGSVPTILVSDRQASPVDGPALVDVATRTLLAEGAGPVELSVSFVDEDEMAELHVRYLGEAGPTDVLSFVQDPVGPGQPDDRSDPGVAPMLGDVVIAPSVARRNNPSDPDGEIRLLLVHGILHLLGYDHDEDAERAEMWARQERYSGVSADQ